MHDCHLLRATQPGKDGNDDKHEDDDRNNWFDGFHGLEPDKATCW